MKRRDLTGFLIPFVYFIAGAVSLASVAATFFYKQYLGLTIEQTQILSSMALIPWSIKPLYGFISDRQPIWGLRRKPYLFLSGILASLGYFSMATWVDSFSDAMIAIVIIGLGVALADVIIDGIVAERSHNQKEAGKLQTHCRAAIMIGALSVSYLSGVLVESVGPRTVYAITACLPLLTALFALLIVETPTTVKTFKLKETLQKLKKALSPTILWSALFLFVWRATPSSGGALNYYVIDELGFDPEFFGKLALVSHSMSIVGVIAFRKFLISVNLKKLFVWIIFASVILSLPNLGLVYGWYNVLGVSPQFFALADTFISAPLTEIGYIPLIVLVARICPKGIEATMFALLASIMNIGLALSDISGAWIVNHFDVRQATSLASDVAGHAIQAANYENLDKVLLIAIFSSLLPLPLVRFLPDIGATEDDEPHEPTPSGKRTQFQPMKTKKGAVT